MYVCITYHTISQTYSFGTEKIKTYSVIKISCPADVNMTRKTNEKLQKICTIIKKPTNDVQQLQNRNDTHYYWCF